MRARATGRERYAVLKDMLEDGRRDLQEKVRSLREAMPAEIVEVRDTEERSFDDRMQQVDIAVMEMRSETLRQIAEALRRLESGTYNACRDCGGAIHRARLRALPFVRLCRACQEAEESREAAERAARLRRPPLGDLVTAGATHLPFRAGPG